MRVIAGRLLEAACGPGHGIDHGGLPRHPVAILLQRRGAQGPRLTIAEEPAPRTAQFFLNMLEWTRLPLRRHPLRAAAARARRGARGALRPGSRGLRRAAVGLRPGVDPDAAEPHRRGLGPRARGAGLAGRAAPYRRPRSPRADGPSSWPLPRHCFIASSSLGRPLLVVAGQMRDRRRPGHPPQAACVYPGRGWRHCAATQSNTSSSGKRFSRARLFQKPWVVEPRDLLEVVEPRREVRPRPVDDDGLRVAVPRLEGAEAEVREEVVDREDALVDVAMPEPRVRGRAACGRRPGVLLGGQRREDVAAGRRRR